MQYAYECCLFYQKVQCPVMVLRGRPLVVANVEVEVALLSHAVSPIQALKPSPQECSNLSSSGFPHFPSQDPPLPQQESPSSPLTHFGHSTKVERGYSYACTHACPLTLLSRKVWLCSHEKYGFSLSKSNMFRASFTAISVVHH